jgi:hypothetical protein
MLIKSRANLLPAIEKAMLYWPHRPLCAATSASLLALMTIAGEHVGSNRIRLGRKKWLRKKWDHNARAHGFFPGEQNRRLLFSEDGTATPRGQVILSHTPMARFGAPCELAGAAVFLASEKASGFVTGIDLRVDGGFLSQTIWSLFGDEKRWFNYLNETAFQAEVRLSIVEADAANQTAKKSLVVRDLPAFNFGTQQIAEKPAEIFMTRVGHKTSRVGQHSHKAVQW